MSEPGHAALAKPTHQRRHHSRQRSAKSRSASLLARPQRHATLAAIVAVGTAAGLATWLAIGLAD